MEKTRGFIIFHVALLVIISQSMVFVSLQKKVVSMPLGNNILEKQVVKAKLLKLWDLEVKRFVINDYSFLFPNDFNKAVIIHVKAGDTVKCKCIYKIHTVALGNISEADANYWGSGNLSYKIAVGLFFPGPPSNQQYQFETRNLPKFSYADVQTWKNQMGSGGRETWTESRDYSWTAAAEHVGKSMYLYFSVDSLYAIPETDEMNNGTELSTGCVAKFIVSPRLKLQQPAPVHR